jgi:hypothetical protein
MLYAGSRPLRLSLKELRELRDALARPPLAATPEQLWRAVSGCVFRSSEAGKALTDLVSLVRFVNEEGDTEKEDQVVLREDFWTSMTGQIHLLTDADRAAYEKHCQGYYITNPSRPGPYGNRLGAASRRRSVEAQTRGLSRIGSRLVFACAASAKLESSSKAPASRRKSPPKRGAGLQPAHLASKGPQRHRKFSSASPSCLQNQ